MPDTTKDTALCQLQGMLVVMETAPAEGGTGHCPLCSGTDFRDDQHGWAWCDECGEFAVLSASLERHEGK